MSKLKIVIIYFILGYFLFWTLAIYKYTKPDFSENQCEVIRQNFYQIELGMSKGEVLSIINKEPSNKVYRSPGFFPEQNTEWEFWMLCADLSSCIVTSSGKEQCYEWHMLAFDTQTQKVVKIFSDNPERIGFV